MNIKITFFVIGLIVVTIPISKNFRDNFVAYSMNVQFRNQSLDFFDATLIHPSARGYQYAEYDRTGRRVIFYPWGGMIKRPHGVVLSYHTDRDFFSKESYEAVDLTKIVSPDAQGFGTGFIDETSSWSYFVPFRKDIGRGVEANDLAIRFDLKKELSDPSAYEIFHLNSLPHKPPKLGWITGAGANGYAFYLPYGTPISRSPWHIPHGILLRYDSRKPFSDPNAWQSYDLERLHPRANGFQSIAFKSPWLYLIPYYPGNNMLVRYNVTKSFIDPSSYDMVDLTSLHPDAIGYTGYVMAGDVLVLTPWRKDVSLKNLRNQSASVAAAFDTRKSLNRSDAWSFFDLTTVSPNAKGYQWGWFDNKGFVHFTPTYNFFTRRPPPFVVWDSAKPFTSPHSWAWYPSMGVPASASAAYDGVYAWLAPYGNNGDSGIITRVKY